MKLDLKWVAVPHSDLGGDVVRLDGDIGINATTHYFVSFGNAVENRPPYVAVYKVTDLATTVLGTFSSLNKTFDYAKALELIFLDAIADRTHMWEQHREDAARLDADYKVLNDQANAVLDKLRIKNKEIEVAFWDADHLKQLSRCLTPMIDHPQP